MLAQEVEHIRGVEMPVERAKNIGAAEESGRDHRVIFRITQDDRRCRTRMNHLRQFIKGLGILPNLFWGERPRACNRG